MSICLKKRIYLEIVTKFEKFELSRVNSFHGNQEVVRYFGSFELARLEWSKYKGNDLLLVFLRNIPEIGIHRVPFLDCFICRPDALCQLFVFALARCFGFFCCD